jgi:hypothetical protein
MVRGVYIRLDDTGQEGTQFWLVLLYRGTYAFAWASGYECTCIIEKHQNCIVHSLHSLTIISYSSQLARGEKITSEAF